MFLTELDDALGVNAAAKSTADSVVSSLMLWRGSLDGDVVIEDCLGVGVLTFLEIGSANAEKK